MSHLEGTDILWPHTVLMKDLLRAVRLHCLRCWLTSRLRDRHATRAHLYEVGSSESLKALLVDKIESWSCLSWGLIVLMNQWIFLICVGSQNQTFVIFLRRTHHVIKPLFGKNVNLLQVCRFHMKQYLGMLHSIEYKLNDTQFCASCIHTVDRLRHWYILNVLGNEHQPILKFWVVAH